MHPGYPLARYGQRVGAFLLDGLVTGVVILLLCVPFHAIRFTNGGGVDSLEATGAAIVISFATNFVYATVMHGWRGQTVGKLALGIAVADAEHGRGIGYPRAALRYLVTFVLSLPFFFLVPALIDHLAPLWDPRRQAWHDRVARSVVVDVRG